MRKIFMVSIPRSGTHWLGRIIGMSWYVVSFAVSLEEQIDDIGEFKRSKNRKGRGHVLPVQQIVDAVSDMPVIFIHRDPKDTLTSWANYNRKRRFLRTWKYWWDIDGYFDSKDKLAWLIERTKPFFDEMLEWKSIADCTVTYEGLHGDPVNELTGIANLLDRNVYDLAERSLSRKGARMGYVGTHRDVFSERHYEIFDEIWR